MSYALLEAIYAGLPVICSDIKENKFAKVFPTVKMVKNEDVNDIYRKMQEIIEKNDFSEEDVLKSREIIDNQYSISCWVKNMVKQYDE